MKKRPSKSLAIATSLSLVLSTVPAPVTAYALGAGDELAEDVSSDDAMTHTPAGSTDEAVSTVDVADAQPATDAEASADAGQNQQEAKPTEETEKDYADLLSDVELDALVMEFDPSEVQQDEEGDISLIAQALHGWKRVWGPIALDTMQKILQVDDVFAAKRGGNVVVATADGYWDALAACGLAGILDAPIVLTNSEALSSQALEEISRLRPDRIVVMGGTSAITDGVYDELRKLAPNIERVAGAMAYDTAVKIYERGEGSWNAEKMAIVCTSNGYWDALSIAPYSYKSKSPIFLTDTNNRLSESALNALTSGGFTSVLIAGGTSAVSSEVEDQLRSLGIADITRKAGPIALDTSAQLAQWQIDHGMTTDYLTVATSAGYWDALSAAPLAAKRNSVIVLVDRSGDYRALDAIYHYRNAAVDTGYIIGGTQAIPNAVEARVTAPWVLKSFSASPSEVRPGGKLTVQTSVECGDADPAQFTYTYAWTRTDGGDSGNSGAIAANSFEITLNQAGEYTITVEVAGPDGTTQTMSTKAYAYSFAGVHAELREGVKWFVSAELGTPNNRADGVEYCFTYRRHGDGATGVLQDWSQAPEAQVDGIRLGALGDTYTVTVEARDGQGSLGSKTVDVAPYKTGNDELDGIVAMLKDRIGSSGRDGMYRAYEYLTDHYTFQNMDRYPPGNWYDWAVPYALDIHHNGYGNCYRYASLMCWLARAYGFDARVVSGQELSGSGWIAHGWCVVNEGGTDYVIDVQQHRELRLIYNREVDLFMKTYDEAAVYYRLI